jgi:DNA invertase Pin-like site-specific DNA recombinase
MSVNVVAYYRVSTQKQGRSGLGLDAQRAAVRRFAEDECLTISAEHIEIETGKGADALERRPELAKALKAARKDKCAVVVAKLDRLSRDVAFIAALMASACRSSLPNWAGTRIRSCCTFTPRWLSKSAA